MGGSNGSREALPIPAGPYRHPRLSHDGKRLAVQTISADGRREIWVYELGSSSQIQRLSGEGNNSRPIWMPDNKTLTFTSDRGGTESIWSQPADGSRPAVQLTKADGMLPHWPDAWSPDGRTLLFTKYVPGDQTIWALSLDNLEKPMLVAGGKSSHQAGGADFSPDGNWIAYRSNEGRPHIQLQPFPTTGAFYDTAQDEGGSYPMWSPDGSQLIYRRDVNDASHALEGKLVAVDVSSKGSPLFNNERLLPTKGLQIFFGYRDYDIASKDKRLLVIFPEKQAEPAAAERPRINVVLNWLEELKKQFPAK